MTTLTPFTLFPWLPLEVRQKVWFHFLPGPRVLHIKQKSETPPRRTNWGGFVANPTTSPASYGGRHPAILSTNQESRSTALRYLTPLFRAYWNLELDAPYFELPEGDNSKAELLLMMHMRAAGQLNIFEHIAIDWMIWEWKMATYTMEFQVTFGIYLGEQYEHPIQIVNSLPNIKTCTFVHTNHTLQRDLETTYVPWHFGPLNTKTTLDAGIVELERAETRASHAIDAKREEFDDPGIKIRLLAIHGRKRECLPPGDLRKVAGWEKGWFG